MKTSEIHGVATHFGATLLFAMRTVLLAQGTYSFWKSGKIRRHFSSQGKVREIGIFFKNQGILMTQYIFISECTDLCH